ncbi:DUF6300 family protein [Actinoallomurus sp. NBC_01490]|jgi:hypothetical protein|uniref:DUF6300 family protein n=1 Tax=Actinoallomurus sp. NBC_01490 TaxID=2903557 RepID=UPI002E32727D|nr:DUF6300 family protein [Actinoallomurus sp. NBC_01490]
MIGVCPRCRVGEVLAILRLPHTWTNASGGRVRGVSEVLLCARCDADDPVTRHFPAHGPVRPQDADRLARDLLRRLARARPPKPDEDALKAETEAWYRGDL